MVLFHFTFLQHFSYVLNVSNYMVFAMDFIDFTISRGGALDMVFVYGGPLVLLWRYWGIPGVAVEPIGASPLPRGSSKTHSLAQALCQSAILWIKKTCVAVQQETMSSCPTARHVFLIDRKTSPLVQHDCTSSCSARRHVFYMSSCWCLLVEQEDISSC